MSEGTTSRRSSWWIWLFLLALLLLLWWCISNHSGMIQNRVATCVGPTLQEAGITTDQYRVDGRDVHLEGDIDANIDTDALISNLDELDCTNSVVNKLNPISWQPASMQLSKVVNDKVTLSGNMPNQENIDTIFTATAGAYGADNVINNMQVTANTRDPVWLNGMDEYIDQIKIADPAGIDANDERIILTGTARTVGDRDMLGEKATAAFLNTVPVTNNIGVMAPTESSMVAYRLADDGKVTLSGTVRDQVAVDTAVDAASASFGADNVINQLTISEMSKPAMWLAGLAPGVAAMVGLNGAALTASDAGVVLEGTANASAMRNDIGDGAMKAFGDLAVDNRITVAAPVDSSMVAYRLADDGKVTLTGTVRDQAAVDTAVGAASASFGADNVINQLAISEMNKPAAWLAGLAPGVAGMVGLNGAVLTASDGGVILEGTVDATATRNGIGDGAMKAFGDLAVDNRITVAPPTDSSMVAYRLAESGKVTLTGTVRDQDAVETAVAAASDSFGADNVINELATSERVKPASWLTGLASGVAGMKGLRDAALSASDSGVVLEGIVDATAKRAGLGDGAKSAFDGLSIDNRILVEIPKVSASIVMDMPQGPGGGITLTGDMPDQSAIGDAAGAAGMLFASNSVSNQMTATETVTSPVWLPGLGSVVKSYGDADNGRITANDNGIVLEGLVDTNAKRDAIGAAAAGTGLSVDNRVRVVARDSGNVVYRWTNNGQAIRLTGELANQAEIDAAVKAAGDIVGNGNVDNQLTVGSRIANAGWLKGVTGLAPVMASSVRESVITASDAGVELEGIVEADDLKSGMGAEARNMIAGLGIANNIRVVVPVRAALTQLDLRGIQFKTNSADLTGNSTNILEQAVALMTEYPDVRVEVAGHTDSQGGDEYNLNLSSARTQSVVAYMSGRGVAGDRLVARGYGESRPIADNDTPEGRAMNRRIEFTIIEQ